jgi:Fic family protein
MAIRNDGDWEGWIKFFLRGIVEVSASATETARAILKMREEHRRAFGGDSYILRLLDFLFERPLLTIRMAEEHLDCSFVKASSSVDTLVRAKVLRQVDEKKRNRLFRFDPYLELFDRQLAGAGPDAASPAQNSMA